MDLGIYQSDVAKELGVSDESINNWENEHNKPQINFYPQIIKFLGYKPFEATYDSIEKRIYAYRCINGLSYKCLGKLLNVDASTVRNWEQSKRRVPQKLLILLTNY